MTPAAEVRNVNQITDRGGCVLSVSRFGGARIFRIGVVPPLSPGAFIWFPGRRRIWLTSRTHRTSTANKELPAGASEDSGRYRGCKCQHFLCGWMYFSCASSARREKFGSHETMLIRPTVATRRSLCQNRQKRAGYRVSDGNRETLTRCHSRSRFWESSPEKPLLNNDWFWNKGESALIWWFFWLKTPVNINVLTPKMDCIPRLLLQYIVETHKRSRSGKY